MIDCSTSRTRAEWAKGAFDPADLARLSQNKILSFVPQPIFEERDEGLLIEESIGLDLRVDIKVGGYYYIRAQPILIIRYSCLQVPSKKTRGKPQKQRFRLNSFCMLLQVDLGNEDSLPLYSFDWHPDMPDEDLVASDCHQDLETLPHWHFYGCQVVEGSRPCVKIPAPKDARFPSASEFLSFWLLARFAKNPVVQQQYSSNEWRKRPLIAPFIEHVFP